MDQGIRHPLGVFIMQKNIHTEKFIRLKVGNQDSPNVADYLDNAMLSALDLLKQSLEKGPVKDKKIKSHKFPRK